MTSFDPRYAPLIFEHIPHGIFTIDAEGMITSFNGAAERITGWARVEVVGRPCREVLRSDHCRTTCFLRNSIEHGEEHRDQEVRIQRRDGERILVAVSTAAVRDGGGSVVGGVEMFRDLSDVVELRRRLEASYRIEDIVSKSAAMKGVRDLLPLVSRSDSTVLIEGEPGTGKELVARAIHNLGPRAENPFVAVNCGAIPDNLVESELFGYVKGAFTDARSDKPGRFALAQGGTLLLDEVSELSPAVQVKLLRVLQEREFMPLGGVVTVRADVRVLAATNRDLASEVSAGRFRQDLFYRLDVVRLHLPPLRCRKDDIPILVNHFIRHFNALQGRRIRGISERAMARLLPYDFPGNVRELENAVEHAFVVCGGSTLELEDLPAHILEGAASPLPSPPSASVSPLESAEADAVRGALERSGGNRNRAAAALGISRNTLWRKMRRHGLLLFRTEPV